MAPPTYEPPPPGWFEEHIASEAKKHKTDPELEATLLYLLPTPRTVKLARALARGGERAHRYVWLGLCQRLEVAFRDIPSDDALIAIAKQSARDPAIFDFGKEAARRRPRPDPNAPTT